MKRFLGTVIAVSIWTTLLFGQGANHVVISEVAPMGGASTAFNTGEYVELYNPLTVDVTFGPNVQLISGNTSGTNAAEWQVSLAGKTLKAYGFLLVGDGGVAGADVAFPASKNLANSGTRSCVQLRDGAAVIDAFGWDNATGPLIPAEGTSFHPSSTSSDKKSFERKSGPLVTVHTTTGNAWDSNNNSTDFFENGAAQANPQNSTSPIAVNPYGVGPSGPGAVTVGPSFWKYNVPTNLRFVVKASSDTTRGLRLVKPSPFAWNSASITIVPDSITKQQSGDTTTFRNFLLKGSDSIVITIPSVTVADSTDEFLFGVASTRDSANFGALVAQPKIVVYGNPRPISLVKHKELNGVPTLFGKWAVVRGVVTVANEFGGPSYLQDATGGMAVFDSSVSNNVQPGDDVVLLGVVAPFNDLFEFAPCTLLQTVSEGIPFDTTVVTIPQVMGQTTLEPLTARLIRINNITKVVTTGGAVATSWNVTGSGTNYVLISGADSIQIRISPRVNLANLPIPNGAFDVVGVLGKFLTTFQLTPRSTNDIISEGAGPKIVSLPPYESNMTSSAMKISWQTDVAGTSTVRFGKTIAYGTEVTDTNKVTLHQVNVSGLSPATIYNMQFASSNAGGATNSPNFLTSTTSLTSAGTINVWFNKSVTISLARGENAQTVDLPTKAIARINAATYSIDVALYSLSGTVGANIATALISAKGRGVKVRVIGEKDNQGTAPWTTLKNASVPLIDDGYDAVNAGAGLMHNKFLVIDNRDTTSDTDDWVWTGSWNATDPGSNDDLQNSIEIQDKSLANAYTVEFNEMWGSDTDTPNATNSRFGARKLENTPHLFLIKSVPIESYFSPSDRTTNHIISTINKAVTSIDFCMLTLTRTDIANALVAKKKAGLKVRGVIDNKSDQGTQFDTLLNRGVDVRLDVNSAFLHHKYGIIDAENANVVQYVITGSHNWTGSAESSNNENTLIIQNNRVANLYLQEFASRYKESGGKDTITIITLDVSKDGSVLPTAYSLEQNYPNPFNPSTNLRFTIADLRLVQLKIFDMLGREVAVLVNEKMNPGTYNVEWNAERCASGVYFVRLDAGTFSATRKLVLMK